MRGSKKNRRVRRRACFFVVLSMVAIRCRSQSTAINIPATPSQQIQVAPPTAVEIVYLGPKGFYPKQITRAPGKFLLIFKRQTRVSNLQIHLDQVGSVKVIDVPLSATNGEWETQLTLGAGVYMLIDDAHPAWGLTLTLK